MPSKTPTPLDIYKPSPRHILRDTDYGNVRVAFLPGKKWRGLVANRAFKEGDWIVSAPVLLISPQERKHLSKTPLEGYDFCWDADRTGRRVPRSAGWTAVAFGLTSMLNHSPTPNCDWKNNYAHIIIDVFAIRDIRRNEELLFNYQHLNGDEHLEGE